VGNYFVTRDAFAQEQQLQTLHIIEPIFESFFSLLFQIQSVDK
jgi:hypothetical protein